MITYRRYTSADFRDVARLWTAINRELAPDNMQDAFERYIEVILEEELAQAETVFPLNEGSTLQIVERDGLIIGTFGIQRISDETAELRRMYLTMDCRGTRVAEGMLAQAEMLARQNGFSHLILSTAEIQQAAIAFYRKNGFTQVETNTEEVMSVKAVGGGLKRLHFRKPLVNQAAPALGSKR